jgi:hypothetical protein
MRRSASEVIRNLEQRIARLEKQNKVAKSYEVQVTTPGVGDLRILTLSQKELRDKISQSKKYSLVNKLSEYIILKGVNEDVWVKKGDLLDFLLTEKGISRGR